MCACSHFGTKAESLLRNHQRLVTIATMLVHFSPQSFNSLPQSVQTAFMELKKVEYRIAKTKELPIEEEGLRRRRSYRLKIAELKQLEMKQTELFQVWKSEMEKEVDREKLAALENRLADLMCERARIGWLRGAE